MSDGPYIPFYTSDFLGGTGGMTAATKGVYITLLCLMYEAEGPLTQTWDKLARRCGCTLPAFKRAVSDLEDDGKVTISGDGIWSDKCGKHIAQRRERQSSAKAAAKKRWQNSKQKQRKPDATASSPQCQPEPEPYIDTNVSIPPIVPQDPAPISDAAQAVEEYNQAAEAVGWPKVQKITKPRLSAINARLSECGGLEGWRVALGKARASPFLTGDNDRGWRADFDFLTKAQKFTQLMEGKYDRPDRSNPQATNAHAASNAVHDATRILVARRFGGQGGQG